MSPRTRSVQTLAGPVRYVDSGWTEQEWQQIRSVMARCVGVQKAAPRHKQSSKEYRAAKHGVQRRSDNLTIWDIGEHKRLDDELSDRLGREP